MEQNTNLSTQQPSGQLVNVVSPRNKKIGLFLITGPLFGLIIVSMLYAILAFILSSTGAAESAPTVAQIIRLVFGLLGIVFVLAFLIGIPVGIVYLNKKELVDGANYDDRSGKKEASIVPDEIKKWNWGAAGLTWIWGVYHGVWISLLTFIPIVNIVMVIVLGIKGSEWAWRSRKWESVEKFVVSQRKWRPWGIFFFILMVLQIIGAFAEVN